MSYRGHDLIFDGTRFIEVGSIDNIRGYCRISEDGSSWGNYKIFSQAPNNDIPKGICYNGINKYIIIGSQTEWKCTNANMIEDPNIVNTDIVNNPGISNRLKTIAIPSGIFIHLYEILSYVGLPITQISTEGLNITDMEDPWGYNPDYPPNASVDPISDGAMDMIYDNIYTDRPSILIVGNMKVSTDVNRRYIQREYIWANDGTSYGLGYYNVSIGERIDKVFICNDKYFYVCNRGTTTKIYIQEIIGAMTTPVEAYFGAGPITSVVYEASSNTYLIGGCNGTTTEPLLKRGQELGVWAGVTQIWENVSLGRTITNNYISKMVIGNNKLCISFNDSSETPIFIGGAKQFKVAPIAPTASSITSTSIIWTSSQNSQVVCDGVTKSSGSMWTGLTPGTAYSAYAFYPEDTIYNQSANSTSTNASTQKMAQFAPSTPVVATSTHNSITWISDNGSKIVCNSVTKDTGSTWTGLSPLTMYTAYAYLPSDATHEASPNSSTTSATTLADPSPSAPSAPSGLVQDSINIKWSSESGTKITMSGLQLDVWENRPEISTIDLTMSRYNDINVFFTECSNCMSTALASTPTTTQYINEFAIKNLDKTNYVSRIKGYITVNTTGIYNLQITGDDYIELWLSSNESPSGINKIAYCQSSTPVNNDDIETNYQSTPYMSNEITLEKGKRYYIETRHIQGIGLGFLYVRWKSSGIPQPTLIKGSSILRPIDKNTEDIWTNLEELQYFYAYAYRPISGGGTGPLSASGIALTGKVRADQSMPLPPTASNVGTTSITWTSSTGSKIVCNNLTKDSGSTWTNLTQETIYTAYAYFPASYTHTRSPDSPTNSEKTLSSKKGTSVSSTRTPRVTRPPTKPEARNVIVLSNDGGLQIGTLIYGVYNYFHIANLVESGSTATWYRADNLAGPWIPIDTSVNCSGNTHINYTLVAGDIGKYLKIGIITRTGTVPYSDINTGYESFSDPTAEINAVQVPPVAGNVRIQRLVEGDFVDVSESNPVSAGDTLKGAFEFFDANDDPMGVCIYRWYRSVTEDPNGDYELITDSNEDPYGDIVYITMDIDFNKTLLFEVTPISK